MQELAVEWGKWQTVKWGKWRITCWGVEYDVDVIEVSEHGFSGPFYCILTSEHFTLSGTFPVSKITKMEKVA